MKVIVELGVDYGRSGTLSGIFVCEKADLEKLYGKEVYFGEVLGKHSEVSLEMDAECFEIRTEDQDFIAKFIEIMGDGTISGYNPFDYYDADEESDEDEDEDDD
ncbi:hypothetical protein [Paraburkholderia sp. J11-2]|uniref:hypothetical protein n=1 Tax=Paraburkholderia sp. J11-2 TaxID=2805431 RepID=UPI002AB6A347|nr:hypothetical protein [Paraburkholderia sp. J11-2]